MSKNYYLRSEVCPLDGSERFQDIHLCKTSIGWKPHFQSFGMIKSVKEYKRYQEVSGDKIVDEYDREYSTWEFWRQIKAWQESEHDKSIVDLLNSEGQEAWLDEEGYEFSEGDFS